MNDGYLFSEIWDIMAKTDNKEKVTSKNDEIKSLIEEIKSNMMSSEDCNNQFYSVLQTLDNISTSIGNISSGNNQPTDEYTILQTNILEVKKELTNLNQNIDETINSDLKELVTKLTEKVNRLEILTNNAGIDQQMIMNITGQIEKNIAGTLRDTSDTLYSQSLSSTDVLRKDISEVNDNMKECVEYLERSVKVVSDDAVQHISDDLTVLGTTVEKTADNLKRSVIDIFSRIQETVEKGSSASKSSSGAPSVNNDQLDASFEMLKTGMYNLNANNEQRFSKLNHLIEELELFNKLEKFSQLKDLPAIGDLKHTLQANLNKIVDEYSYTLQNSQDRDELSKSTQQFRKDVYNSIISMLGNVSEFLLEDENNKTGKKTQIDIIYDKLDELTSVTELNNSGYDNVQIEINDLREKCSSILDSVKEVHSRLGSKTMSLDETISEIKNDLLSIQINSDAIRKDSAGITDVVRECTNSIIESSVPDRNNIKDLLVDIKKNISILQSGDEESDYTYSMQDIEEDVAKIRIYLNELTQNGISINSDEFTDELNGVVVMVDSMKQQLNKIDECNLSETMSKIQEDVTSVSTRVNKLLLTSDNSYNMVEAALNEFKVLSEQIDEQIQKLASSNKFSALEENINAVKASLEVSNNYSNVINQSLIMLAEWVDNAGEMITDINENQAKSGDISEIKLQLQNITEGIMTEVKGMLAEINTRIPEQIDYTEIFTVIGNRLDEQDQRLAKLDEKLSMILEISAKNDYSELNIKMNEIDEKMEKLNRSIEKLTSFVNED